MHPVIHTTSPVKRNWEPSCKEDQIWSIYAGTKFHQKSTQILYNRLLSDHKEAGKATLPIPNIKLLSTSLIPLSESLKGWSVFLGSGKSAVGGQLIVGTCIQSNRWLKLGNLLQGIMNNGLWSKFAAPLLLDCIEGNHSHWYNNPLHQLIYKKDSWYHKETHLQNLQFRHSQMKRSTQK
jgi:hypothetical protein